MALDELDSVLFNNSSLNFLFSNCSYSKPWWIYHQFWSLVLQYFIQMVLFSKLSLKMWCQTSVCLVLLCWTGFLAILRALVLSQMKGIVLLSTPKSSIWCFIHSNWAQQDATATYSTSTVKKNHCVLLFSSPRDKRRAYEVNHYWSALSINFIPCIICIASAYPTS